MNVEIADRLVKRRRKAGYSQESLAEKLGVSRQAVSKWERSESSPDTDNLIALAQLYGVSIDDLLYVDERVIDSVTSEKVNSATEQNAEVGSRATSDLPYNEDRSDRTTDPDSEQGQANGSPENSSIHFGLGGVHVMDGDDYVHVSFKDGVHVRDSGTGEEVHVGFDGIYVNEGTSNYGEGSGCPAADSGKPYKDWGDAKVFINGNKYDSWHDAEVMFKDKYGIEKTWMKFPFPLVAIIVYLLLGFLLDAWAIGLFVFISIPVYYMIGHLIYSKRLGHFLESLYAVACIAWFLWMAFVVGQPHPAWVIFLTIPVVEWIFHTISRKYRNRKKEAEVVDVGE